MLQEQIIVDERADGSMRRLIATPLNKDFGSSYVVLTQARCVDRGVHFHMTNLEKIGAGNGTFFKLDDTFKKGVVLMVCLLTKKADYLVVLEVTDEKVVFSDPFETLCEAYQFGKAYK